MLGLKHTRRKQKWSQLTTNTATCFALSVALTVGILLFTSRRPKAKREAEIVNFAVLKQSGLEAQERHRNTKRSWMRGNEPGPEIGVICRPFTSA